MASISSPYHWPCNCYLFTSSTNYTTLSSSTSTANNKTYLDLKRKHQVLSCKSLLEEEQRQSQESLYSCFELPSISPGRREALFNMTFTAFNFPAIISNALAGIDVTENFSVYTDDVNKFQISVPNDWQVGSGEPAGFKSVTAFYPEEDSSNSSVSVVITGLGPDFTRMESFGKVDAFAETLVSGLDRSWKRPPGVAAKLIDCKSANGLYYIEYTLQNPGERRKHLFSVLGMAFNGWYNRLYTVTGQFVDEESEKYSSQIQKVASTNIDFVKTPFYCPISELKRTMHENDVNSKCFLLTCYCFPWFCRLFHPSGSFKEPKSIRFHTGCRQVSIFHPQFTCPRPKTNSWK
ncbi:hypothetical protein K2173_007493 [Erythroxylum novogranatense]|uniref:PsbP C-terminal domain-containing protein n=1 Tax=Erythroxylum novogranatense TaxID=1862640 RepID=A0AAV8T7V3_9ROSI|nr:hypothetical protein K2173_007493 [Erythroxylum novogranatense]